MSGRPESIAADEAGCLLFLISPPRPDLEGLALDLESALRVRGAAAFLLEIRAQDPALVTRAAEVLSPVCAAHEVAFLVEDDLDLALRAGAAGVQVGSPEHVKGARQRLGAKRILGAACGRSRHDAMLAGEAGADYVAFAGPLSEPEQLELVRWWSEVTVLPCLALGATRPEGCTPAVQAGAAFIGVGDGIWRQPGGAAAAVGAFFEAIAGAR